MDVLMLLNMVVATTSCQGEQCGSVIRDQVLLQQAREVMKHSRQDAVTEDNSDKSCSSVVPGAVSQRTDWWKPKECTCPDGDVLRGANPACWDASESKRSFLAESLLGKQCRCGSDNYDDLGVYTAFSWSMAARKLCKSDEAKVVYWVRHAEGKHQKPNKVACLWERDPPLTEVGMEQAENLKDTPVLAAALFNASERAQLVVSSPLQRTMLTAILGFTDVLKSRFPTQERAKWLLDSDCQEFPGSLGPAELNCNKGDVEAGEAALNKYSRGDLLQQYQALDPAWTDRTSGRYTNSQEKQRFRDFTARLAQRAEKRIIVVSHGKFMQHGLGSDSPKANAVVKPFALCGDQWHYLGA